MSKKPTYEELEMKNRELEKRLRITAMSGHLTQQSMKELELLIVSSFI